MFGYVLIKYTHAGKIIRPTFFMNERYVRELYSMPIMIDNVRSSVYYMHLRTAGWSTVVLWYANIALFSTLRHLNQYLFLTLAIPTQTYDA